VTNPVNLNDLVLTALARNALRINPILACI
jgi:hypothetical protein